MKRTLEAPGVSQESFAALAAAVSPAWHQAVIRLANALQDISDKLDLLFESSGKDMRYRTRELIESMVNYLDMAEGDPNLEDDDDREPVGDDEPSLGSFDRVTNQEKSWRLGWADLDAELDTADNEPSLGSLERSCCAAGWRDGERNPTGDQTLWGHSPRNDLEDEHDGREPDESGIGDYDGLLEQIATQDWQHGGMV